MSKKRGLSLEEKRQKLLEIFYETQDFFLLKELEKSGPKKGIISQSVKDVLQSLVDDDLVFKEKIGTSVYFWSLPSRAVNQLKQQRENLETKQKKLQERREECQRSLEASSHGREDTEERAAATARLAQLESQNTALKAEAERFSDNDPATLEAMGNASDVAKAAANRWTENIFALQQWCANTFPHMQEGLASAYKEVGITDDIDYIEE